MLSGPAILRISVLLIIAGALAALVQVLLPADQPATVAEPPAVARTPEPAPQATPPAASAPGPAVAIPQTPPAPDRRTATPARTGPVEMPADALAFPRDPSPPTPAAPVPASPPAAPPRGEAEVARAEADAGPRAVALVDLNTASVADLNRLQGGGTIGRAIVAKRPYASVDQLLSKRVLSRAVYDRIREQVTVR